MDTLPADRIVHQETGSRSPHNGNPDARPFSRLVVSSESNEYCSSPPGYRCSLDPTRLLGIDDSMVMVREPDDLPILIGKHRVQRLNFDREHQDWQLRHWRPVLFTYESMFTVSTNDRHTRAWIRQGERYADCNIVEVDRYGGGSVMVWAEISLDGRTDLYVFPGGGITIVRYRNEVLQPLVRPYAGAIGDTIVLMQDNARAPTARVSMTFLDDERITVMNLPARSPHLNPIAHV